MGTVLVKVHPNLIKVFYSVGKKFAEDIKKKYNLTELYVPNTLASQILAGLYNKKKEFEFHIRKTGFNKGVLEIVS